MRSLLLPLLAACGLCLSLSLRAQEKVIRLYDGSAPGSEKWTHSEKEVPKTV